MNWAERFPVEPYQIQVEFAKALYEALKEGTKLCFMESPTGTGKSYSLLVGLTAWLEQHRFSIESDANTKEKSLPGWLKKATDVTKQSEARHQQKKLEDKLAKINANLIGSAKAKKLLAAVTSSKQPTASNQQQSDQQIVDPEQQNNPCVVNGKRTLILKSIGVEEETLYQRPRIIFTSRTHSQLTQIIQSFQRLKTELVACALASKKHMCVHPRTNSHHSGVKVSADVDSNCTRLLDRSKCQFYTKESYKEMVGVDVAEAVELGDKHSVCPYFASKQLFDVADVICVPYASIMKRSVRDRLGLHLKNSIVVFDEGHNVVEYDLSSRSTQLKYKDLCQLNSRLTTYIDKYTARLRPSSKYILDHLSNIINELLTLMKKKYETHSTSQSSYTKTNFIDFLLELQTTEIEYQKIRAFTQLNSLSNRLYFITNESGYQAGTLQRVLDFFKSVIFDNDKSSLVLCKLPPKNQGINDTVLKTLLFQPKCLEEVVEQSRMCVFAGGTLHPLSQLEPIKELCDGRFLSREFQHIIPLENCRVMLVDRYNKAKLLFNFKNKENREHISAIGDIIGRVAQLQKEGIIVFLQSYKYLQTVRQSIKERSYYKCCYFDGKDAGNIFESYQKQIKDKQPAILFSVMGGRLSQGINFSDQLARRLLIFGLPFSDVKAPEIAQRMAYYDRQKGQLTGRDYYQNLCMRTVNQTIGRAIRHRNDRAVIYLIDERFRTVQSKLSKWLRNRCQSMADGADVR